MNPTNEIVDVKTKNVELIATGNTAKVWGTAIVGIACLVGTNYVKNPPAKIVLTVFGAIFLAISVSESLKIKLN